VERLSRPFHISLVVERGEDDLSQLCQRASLICAPFVVGRPNAPSILLIRQTVAFLPEWSAELAAQHFARRVPWKRVDPEDCARHLKWARCSRQKPSSSASETSLPSRRATNALVSRPIPTTALPRPRLRGRRVRRQDVLDLRWHDVLAPETMMSLMRSTMKSTRLVLVTGVAVRSQPPSRTGASSPRAGASSRASLSAPKHDSPTSRGQRRPEPGLDDPKFDVSRRASRALEPRGIAAPVSSGRSSVPMPTVSVRPYDCVNSASNRSTAGRAGRCDGRGAYTTVRRLVKSALAPPASRPACDDDRTNAAWVVRSATISSSNRSGIGSRTWTIRPPAFMAINDQPEAADVVVGRRHQTGREASGVNSRVKLSTPASRSTPSLGRPWTRRSSPMST